MHVLDVLWILCIIVWIGLSFFGKLTKKGKRSQMLRILEKGKYITLEKVMEQDVRC